jgi:hypothetical protein
MLTQQATLELIRVMARERLAGVITGMGLRRGILNFCALPPLPFNSTGIF